MAAEQTGVFVVRAWFEDDGLRARVTRTLDISRPEVVESAAASEDEIVSVLRDWLREFTVSATSS